MWKDGTFSDAKCSVCNMEATMKHVRVYRMLVTYGHTPQKALEIVVEARRHNQQALDWIRMVHKLTH